jgi:hypothetical protein
MRPSLRRAGVGIAVLVASALAGSSATSSPAPAGVHLGCPPKAARLGVTAPVTIDEVIRVARATIVGAVSHYQGRTERRTRENTPVEAVFMDLGFAAIPRTRALLPRAKRQCGFRVARRSSAVLFHDGLSVIADATITKFVVKTARGWWVYDA